MKVLVAANMYPSPDVPSAGVFIKREVDALRELLPDWTIEVVRVDTVTGAWRYGTGVLDFSRATRRVRPDVVHVHYGLSQLFAWSWRGPKVVTFHGSDLAIPWQRRISTLALPSRAVPIVVASHMLSSLEPEQAARARVVPCGVDTGRFVPTDSTNARVRMGWPTDRLLVGFPANPARPEKDYGLFSQVIAVLPTISACEVEAVALDGIAPEEMPVALSALDVLLVTSQREGSPVVTREAMCCGTRVVATDAGDLAEQVDGMRGCTVVGVRDPLRLAEAVVAALLDSAPDPSVAAGRFGIVNEARSVLEAYSHAIEVCS